MARIMRVDDSIEIAASPDVLYAMVSDLTRMGEWSPENRGARIVEPAPGGGAFVGMQFDGDNARNIFRWVTTSTVTVADPGERLAFRVHAIGVLGKPFWHLPIASWEYRFTALPDGGTRVTEEWNDGRVRWPRFVCEVFDRIATFGSTFPQYQRRNIASTLRALKVSAEATTGKH